MPRFVTVGTLQIFKFFVFLHHRYRDDTCGYGNNSVADQHNAGGQEFAEGGSGGDVSITDGGHGDDAPVNTVRDVIELCIGLSSLDHVHQRTDGDDEDDDKEKKNGYLFTTFFE